MILSTTADFQKVSKKLLSYHTIKNASQNTFSIGEIRFFRNSIKLFHAHLKKCAIESATRETRNRKKKDNYHDKAE